LWRTPVNRMVIGTILTVLTASAVAARQLVPERKYIGYGLGSSSCGAYAPHRHDTVWHASELSWAQGFVSGVGSHGVRFKAQDSDGIQQWLDAHCQQRPLDSLAAAAFDLVTELQP